MNLIIQNKNDGVITLKEITDLINTRHDRAMQKVNELCKEDSFGAVSKIDIVYNEQGQKILTYLLNKKQAIAVGAKLNNSLLMKVIDRIEELENQNKPKTELDLIIQSAQEMQKITQKQDEQQKRIELLEDSQVINTRQKYSLKKLVQLKVYELKENHNLDDSFTKKNFQRIWKKLKDKYLVNNYSEIPFIKFDEAIEIVKNVSLGDLI